MSVAIGQLLDHLGLAQKTTLDVIPDRTRGFDVQARHRAWATPSTEVRKYQPAKIKVNIDHGRDVVGHVVHLHRDRGNRLWAVAELYGQEIDPSRLPRFYYSVETNAKRDFTDVVITGVGLVDRTAQTGTQPVKILPGTARDNKANRDLSEQEREIMAAAAETIRFRKDPQAPITVYDENEQRLIGQAANNPAAWELMERQQDEFTRYRGKIEIRPSTITRVY